MKILAFIFCVLIIQLSCRAEENNQNQDPVYTPKIVVELWRHGARAAARNTFKQDYVVQEGPGNLIGNGMRMHYVLGQAIRNKYKDTLFTSPAKYSDYEVTSSQVQRTMLSAYSHMLGIYPLGEGLKTTNDVDSTKMPPFVTAVAPSPAIANNALEGGYKPIPVNVIPQDQDDVFMKGFEKLCPKADKFVNDEFKKRVASPERMELIKDVAKVITDAGYTSQEYFKEPEWTSNTTGIFADVDKCFYFHEGVHMGKVSPDLVTGIADELEWVFGIYYFDSSYPNDQISKLYTTKMAKYVLQKMTDKMDPTKSSSLKFAGLSGHESNVIPFMSLYKLTNLNCMIDNLKKKIPGPTKDCETPPKFAANFMWELSQDDNSKKWYVATYFNNNKIKSCDSPNKDMYCDYSEFEAFMNKNFILNVNEYIDVCGPPTNPAKEEESKLYFYLAIVMAGLFLVLLVVFLSYLYKHSK